MSPARKVLGTVFDGKTKQEFAAHTAVCLGVGYALVDIVFVPPATPRATVALGGLDPVGRPARRLRRCAGALGLSVAPSASGRP